MLLQKELETDEIALKSANDCSKIERSNGAFDCRRNSINIFSPEKKTSTYDVKISCQKSDRGCYKNQ